MPHDFPPVLRSIGTGGRRAVLSGVLCIAAGAATRTAYAIDPSKPLTAYTVRVWRAADGLGGDNVLAITQTKDGYLWIAGNAGLTRYDGGGFQLVYPRHDTASGNQEVRRILARRNGALWVAIPSGTGGLVIDQDRIEPLSLGGRVASDHPPRAFHEDGDGVVWILAKDELLRFDGTTTTSTRVPSLPGQKAGVLHDRQGRTWVSATGGLLMRRAEGEAFQALPGPSPRANGLVRAMYEDRAGRIWAGAENNIWLFDGVRFVELGPIGADVGVGTVEAILEDRHGSLWIAGAKGLARYREGRLETFGEADGLPDANITSLFEDQEGSLWVGTYAGGIAQFTDRTLPTAPQMGVHAAWLDAVCEDVEGRIWLGARARHGAACLEDGRVTWVGTDLRSAVRACQPRPAGGVWLGTNNGDVVLVRGGAVERRVPMPAGVMPSSVTALAGDGAEGLWIGTFDGLLHFDGETTGVVGPERGLLKVRIWALSPDRAGNLWVGAETHLWRQRAGRFEVVPGAPSVHTVYHDGSGATWLGTALGLFRADEGRLMRFDIRSSLDPSLPAEPIHQILADRAGNLWMTGRHQIFRVTRQALDAYAAGRHTELETVAYATSDRRRGIVVNMSQASAWRGGDGRLHFATRQGLISFDPAGVTTNPLPPPIAVQRVVVDARAAPPGTSYSAPPGAGSVEFNYVALSFQEPQKNRFRYRLEGFENRWIEAGVRRAAFYTNVPPGSYRFQVQGSNNDGVWNTVGASFALTLAPRFHQTRLFLVLCVAAGLGAVGFAYNLRLRSLRARYLAVFAERTRVARELHDTLLQSMTAVWAELGAVIRKLPDTAEKERSRLRSVSDMVAQSLDEARNFVADLRERDGSEGDLARALTLLAERLSNQGTLSCTVEVTGTAWTLPQQVASELYRIAQEALRNVIKHAAAGHVACRLDYLDQKERTITMEVSDDGRGFDPAEATASTPGHFGLLGMRERAQRIGATFAIQSSPTSGTKVTVTWSPAAKGSRDG